MKRFVTIFVIAALMSAMSVPSVFAVTISAPGESCIYFAGQTQPDLEALYPPLAGWENNPWDQFHSYGEHGNFHNDSAPWEGVVRAYNKPAYSDETARTASSTIPPFIDVTGWEAAGVKLSITATGIWAHAPDYPHTGPDGYGANYATHGEYDQLGISRVYAPLNSLIGVFLGDDAPDPAAIPASLMFGIDDMTTPVLQQTFAIGSNLENITIPSGATRLFFGIHDEYEWWNNDGDMNVTVTPEPATLLLLGLGGFLLRRRRGR